MVDLQAKAKQAIEKTFSYFSKAVVSVTFTNVTDSVYDPLEQTVTKVEVSETVDAIKTSFSHKEVDGIAIQRKDFKLLIRNWKMNGLEVSESTSCTINGVKYNVIGSALKSFDQLLWVQARMP